MASSPVPEMSIDIERRAPLVFTQVFNGALTASWQLICTTTANTRGLVISPAANASTFDIEVASVPNGAAAPTATKGRAVMGGEDFPAGLPIGDIYLKSASLSIAIVEMGA